MYRNPANYNGDLSDYNLLKKQRNNSGIIKKYSSKKLKTEPTELQKYYEYLTYQQSILDEINYTAEKLKTENIKKQKEDFEFLEKLKEEREKKMKGFIDKTEPKTVKERIKETLFEPEQISLDLTPSFQTENELELDIRDINFKEKEQTLKEQASNLLKASIKRAQIQPLYREGAEYQRKVAKKEAKEGAKEEAKEEAIQERKKEKISKKKNSTIASEADTEQANIPRNKRNVGRPKGIKNKPKKTLDIRPTSLNL